MNRMAWSMPLAAAALIFSSVGICQDQLQEVIVTATKSGAVDAQKIAGGIAALQGSQLEKSNVRSLSDLPRLVPTLQMGEIAPGDLQPIIRGIASPGASTVGVYFDETVVSGVNFQNGGGRTPDVGAYDIQRVEVLEGPQGTLFGASSMTGTIRFISNKPDATAFDARVSVRGAGLDNGSPDYGGDGMVNLPLVHDRLALRAVGWYENYGGYINEYTGLNAVTRISDANQVKKYGGRVMLRWTPFDNLKVDGFLMRQKLTDAGTLGFNNTPNSTQLPITIVEGAPFLIGLTVPGLHGVDGTNDMTVPSQNSNSSEITLFGTTATYDAGFGTFVATASKFSNDPYMFEYDTSGTTPRFGLINFPLFFSSGQLQAQDPFQVDQQQIRDLSSGEFRFNSHFNGPVNFVIGAFEQREDSDTRLIVVTTNPVTGAPLCVLWTQCISNVNSAAADSLLFATEETYVVNSSAYFGDVTYQATDKLKFDVGGRYFDAREHAINYTEQAFQGSIPFTTPPSSGGPVNTVPQRELNTFTNESKPTWDTSVSYQLTPDQMYYFRAATGFRQGGPNDTTTAKQLGIIIPGTFGPDTVYSYEVGEKTEWLDHRLKINGALYHENWINMQVPGQDPTGVITYIDNAAASEINGVEFTVAARPTDEWEFSVGGTYVNAYLTENQTSDGGPAGVEGNRIPKVPHLSGSASIEYYVPHKLFGSVATTLQTTMSYTGTSMTFFNNTFQDNLELGGYYL